MGNFKIKKTHEEFLQEIEERYPNKFKFITEYSGALNKIRLFCNDCKNEIDVFPNSLLKKGSTQNKLIGCKYCSVISKTMTQEEFLNKIFNDGNGEYIALSPYVNSKEKFKIKHLLCEHEYEVSPTHFFNSGSRCPNCIKNKRLTNDVIRLNIRKLNRKDYELVDIIDTKTIKIKHLNCGYVWNVLYQNFIRMSNCPKCSGNYKRTHEDFVREVKDIVGDEYEVVGQFVNTKTKIEMFHVKCGNNFLVTPTHFITANVRCSYCFYNGQSKKEEEIENFLKILNVKYERQYAFDDCRYKFPLPFDFAIFDSRDNLKFLIEYNGEQHYREVEFFGGKEKFEKQKRNDAIKLEYCVENNINLVVIPYSSFKNFKEIILNNLNQRGWNN